MVQDTTMHDKAMLSRKLELDGGSEQRRREWRRTGLYLVAGLALFAFGLWRSLETSDPLAHPGDRLPSFPMDLDEVPRSKVESGRWTWLFLNFDDRLLVAERAARWSAFSETKPRVLLLTPSARSPATTEPVLEVIPLRALSPEIRTRLGSVDGRRRVLLINPDLEVVFAARFLQAPDVDALYRRHLGLANIDLDKVRLASFRGQAGERFEGPAVWFVFHQGCSQCSLTLGFEALQKSWLKLAPSCNRPDRSCSVVVDPQRETSEIRSQLQQAGLPLGVISVAGLDRLLRPQDHWFSQALVVQWDEFGRIRHRGPLEAFLGGLAAGGSTMLEVEGTEIVLPEAKSVATSRIADLGFDASGKQLGVLDGEEHRLRIFEQQAIVQEVGAIGVRPGELFYPEAFDWLPDGGTVVHDAGNGRVKLFDAGGLFDREIRPTTKPVGLATSSGGDIFVGEPGSGRLITRYGLSGRVESSFGSLLEAKGELERQATNRVHLVRGENGELWVAFLHHLLVRRYSSETELLAEVDLRAKLAERGTEVSSELPAVNIDGFQLPVQIQDIAFAAGSDREAEASLWLLLGDGHVIQLSSSGELGFVGLLRGGVHWGHIAVRGLPNPGLLLAEFRGRRMVDLDLEKFGNGSLEPRKE